jgi:hypothetical protein
MARKLRRIAIKDDDAAGLDCGTAKHGQPGRSGLAVGKTQENKTSAIEKLTRVGNMTISLTDPFMKTAGRGQCPDAPVTFLLSF